MGRKSEGFAGSSLLGKRIFIDSTSLNKYTLNGKRELGIVNNVNSLRHILMGMCADFLNEEGMLQYIATKIGVTVLLTPKCHAKLTGEGIEYMWACSKVFQGCIKKFELEREEGEGKLQCKCAPLSFRENYNSLKNMKVCMVSSSVPNGLPCH